MTKTKSLIVFVAVLQAVLLFLLVELRGTGYWLLPTLSFSLASFVVVFSGPTAYLLFLQERLLKSALWYGVILWLLFAAAMMYTVYSFNTGEYRQHQLNVMEFRAALALSIAWFILLPFVQNRLHGRSFFYYPGLYTYAWANFIAISISLLFTGICWLLLFFVTLLFHIIDIDFIEKIIQEKVFIYPFSGLVFGLGMLIGKNKSKIVEIAHMVLLLILKGLLPILSIVLICFAVLVPIQGLDVLFADTSLSIVSTLMLAIFLMVTKINAVYRDGQDISNFPRVLHWLIVLGVIVLPVYAALMCYGLYLRVAQYGWTEERVWAALIVVVLIAYALGYAYKVIRTKGEWRSGIGNVNVMVAILIIIAAFAVNSPLLDPKVIGVKSQVSRLLTGQMSVEEFDYAYLRFRSGKVGIEALQALKSEADLTDRETFISEVDKVLNTDSYYNYRYSSEKQFQVDELTPALVEKLFDVVPSSHVVDAVFWEYIDDVSSSIVRRCKAYVDRAHCVLLVLDLNADGVDEYVLTEPQEYCRSSPAIYQQTLDDEWVRVGTMRAGCSTMNNIITTIEAGEHQLVESYWKDLRIGDKQIDVSIHTDVAR